MSRILPLLPALLALSCTGHVTNQDGQAGSSGPGLGDAATGGSTALGDPDAPITGAIDEHCQGQAPPGRVLLRRLNREQLGRTLRDLTGLTFSEVHEFPADEAAAGFDNQAVALSTSALHVEKYFELAKRVANAVMTDKAARAAFVVGDPALQPSDAARQALSRFGRRAYRHSLTESELSALLALFEEARLGGLDFDRALEVPLRAVLTSTHFIFHEPVAAAASAEPVRLSGTALASRLSYFLWGSTPDDALLTSAESGALDAASGLRAAAARLLADPRAEGFVDGFAGQWLDLRALSEAHPEPELFPSFTSSLLLAMGQESARFFRELLEPGQDVRGLLRGGFTYANAELARHYGLDTQLPAAELGRVSLLSTERAGFLTQGAFLVQSSHPDRTSLVKRGKWTLEQLLCSPPPPPPPGVEALPADAGDAQQAGTLRQQVEQHRAKPECAGCHASMDPIGFGLEHFDAIGRYRALDGGRAIDARGDLPGADGELRAFNGARELSELLATDARFPHCVAQKVFTYALARAPLATEACVVDALSEQFQKSGSTLSELIAAVVQVPAFTHADPERGL